MKAEPLRSIFFLSPAGLLLAICFFLPAVGTGGCVTYPYEAPALAGPYLFGLTVFLSTFKILSQKLKLPHFVISILCSLSLSFFLNWETMSDFTLHPTSIFFSLVWLGLFAGLILVFKRGLPFSLRVARITWLTAGICIIWFSYWTLKEPPRIGLWLSLVASLFIFLGALLKEREIRTL